MIPDPMDTLRDGAMLIRAGVITAEDRDDFRAHPHRWRHEVASCRKLEDAMHLASVDPAEGWNMTQVEMIKRTIGAIRKGRADIKGERSILGIQPDTLSGKGKEAS